MKIENIKFKAKRLDNQEWTFGDFMNITDKEVVIVPLDEFLGIDVNSSTVCQFTGAQDCNGTPIYEHDLLRNYEETSSIYEVVWNQRNTSFSLVNTESPVLYPNTLGEVLRNSHLKVIGNKFDKKGGKQ